MRKEEIGNLKDKQITCKICGISFVFSIGEQTFYHDRGLADPKRCPECRQQKHNLAPEGVRDG